ncbi:MAG TPA: glycosyltransferase family 39 protein [Thermoanaerobaculia bacterium]|jgi:hypothetical protein
MPRRFHWTLAGIVVAASALRLYRLGHFSYDIDEIFQGFWIRGDWAFFWRSLRLDAVHPPLDYLLDRLALLARPSNEMLKVVPLLWGAATVAALGVLVARRAGEPAGLAAAAVLAFAPYHIRYSQELRPYALGALLLLLSLYALDRFLERPRAARLALTYLTFLATMYALYLAAVVLAIAAAAMLFEDAADADVIRRSAARRFLAWSPVFGAILCFGYLPWWPVVLEAARRPPFVPVEPLTAPRLGQILSFFAFAPVDGEPLRRGTVFLWSLAALGAALALGRPRQRMLVVWCVAGWGAVEILGQIHPHFHGTRRFLPAGIAATALAGIALGELLRRPVTRIAGTLMLSVVLVLSSRNLVRYFRDGRADWRPLVAALRREAPPHERIFTENQASAYCVAFYLVGPEWLYQASGGGTPARSIVSLGAGAELLNRAWWPGHPSWLVLGCHPASERLRKWAVRLPCRTFPTAEDAALCALDPSQRDASLALLSETHGP